MSSSRVWNWFSVSDIHFLVNLVPECTQSRQRAFRAKQMVRINSVYEWDVNVWSFALLGISARFSMYPVHFLVPLIYRLWCRWYMGRFRNELVWKSHGCKLFRTLSRCYANKIFLLSFPSVGENGRFFSWPHKRCDGKAFTTPAFRFLIPSFLFSIRLPVANRAVVISAAKFTGSEQHSVG